MAKSFLTLVVLCAISLTHEGSEKSPAPPPPAPASSNSCGTAYNVLANGGLSKVGLSYQRTGDVFVSCTGLGEVQLTHFGDVLFFALFGKGAKLAVLRQASPTSRLLQVLDIPAMTVTQSRIIPKGISAQVSFTCGTGVLFERTQPVGITTALDLADMSPIPIGKARESRCSDDRSVLVEAVLTTFGTDLMLEKPHVMQLANNIETYRANPTEMTQFALSPNGRFFAYVEETDLCLSTTLPTGVTKRCTDLVWPAGKLTVSDAGIVLFTAQTDEACPVGRTAVHHAWPCEAIFDWDPEHKNTRLARFLAVDPQILSAGDGAAIFSIVGTKK